jgi:type IV pilus assembly protein PilA
MLHTRKGGFTLIELMIVVAIIGILAAIAIPNFLQFQLRSKTGEAKTTIAAIRTAEEGYFAEFNNYVLSVANPPTAGTQNKQPWPTGSGFDNLGWSPEGQVFFQYSVNAPTGVASYQIGAMGDLDGNLTATSDYGYVHPVALGVSGPGPTMGNCAATGVYNSAAPAAFDLLNTVGPCTNLDGQSDF